MSLLLRVGIIIIGDCSIWVSLWSTINLYCMLCSFVPTLYPASLIICFPLAFHMAGTVITQWKSVASRGWSACFRCSSSLVFRNFKMWAITSTRLNCFPFNAFTFCSRLTFYRDWKKSLTTTIATKYVLEIIHLMFHYAVCLATVWTLGLLSIGRWSFRLIATVSSVIHFSLFVTLHKYPNVAPFIMSSSSYQAYEYATALIDCSVGVTKNESTLHLHSLL